MANGSTMPIDGRELRALLAGAKIPTPRIALLERGPDDRLHIKENSPFDELSGEAHYSDNAMAKAALDIITHCVFTGDSLTTPGSAFVGLVLHLEVYVTPADDTGKPKDQPAYSQSFADNPHARDDTLLLAYSLPDDTLHQIAPISAAPVTGDAIDQRGRLAVNLRKLTQTMAFVA